MTEEEIRPRYGVVNRIDGTELLVTFVTSDMKDAFRMTRADTGEPVILNEGETFTVLGKMTTDQAILYQMSGDQNERVGRPVQRGKRGATVVADKNSKSPLMAALGALGVLAATLALLLATAAGIKAIFWGF